MTFVAPRNVNDVSYVTRIKHAYHFLWQAQYLAVKVQCHFSWPWEGHVSLFLAGTVLGEGPVSLYVACTVLGASLFLAGTTYLVKVKCHFSWQAQSW